MSRLSHAVLAVAIAGAMAIGAPSSAAALDRPAVIVDLTVLDTLNPEDNAGRPDWRPPIPGRRPIPPTIRLRQTIAEPEGSSTPAPAPILSPAVSLTPAAPEAESQMLVRVSAVPAFRQRPTPVTASASLLHQVGARSTAPALSASDKLIGANVDIEATADIISALPNGDGFRMVFAGDRTALSDTGEQLLDIFVDRMGVQTDLRLSVLAYAGGSPETASRSRLLSLERALAVRNYLSDRGIRGSRIDLRAMGNTYIDGPPERVDLLLTE